LGQFDYSVKQGDQVKVGDVIGQTNPRSTGGLSEGKIYFEVRKNNLAQNTYLLLDKKTLAKNSSN
jgi:murein DD-endopeptidase MepM/ murein hydrolase activator NlpD